MYYVMRFANLESMFKADMTSSHIDQYFRNEVRCHSLVAPLFERCSNFNNFLQANHSHADCHTWMKRRHSSIDLMLRLLNRLE